MKRNIIFLIFILLFYCGIFAETNTITPTNTETVTETNTETITETITETPEEMYSATETITETTTLTITPTLTETQSLTITLTITPTITATNTLTFTNTIPVSTWTHSMTVTPSPTITQTLTPVYTATISDYYIKYFQNTLYPNPVKYNGEIFMLYECDEISDIIVEIYKIDGKKIKEYTFERKEGKGKIKFAVNDIAPGIYLYRTVIKSKIKENKEKLKKLLILK